MCFLTVGSPWVIEMKCYKSYFTCNDFSYLSTFQSHQIFCFFATYEMSALGLALELLLDPSRKGQEI